MVTLDYVTVKAAKEESLLVPWSDGESSFELPGDLRRCPLDIHCPRRTLGGLFKGPRGCNNSPRPQVPDEERKIDVPMGSK